MSGSVQGLRTNERGERSAVHRTGGLNVEYGYVRVSAKDQNIQRQLIAMQEAGLVTEQIFIDKQSGKDFDRPAYRRLLGSLCQDDVLVIKSIDRLGRNYDEILEQWRIITKEKEAAIVVLDMPLLDTRKNRDLTGTLIADIVLQLLSYVAQTERDFIRQRQAEGIAAAKERGVQFGRRPKPIREDFTSVLEDFRAGQLTSRQAAASMGVSPSTFYKWIKESGGVNAG